MSDHQNQFDKGEPSKSLKERWAQYRAWVAGLDRKQRLRYRLCQILAVVAIVTLIVILLLRSWIRLPDVPTPPGMDPDPTSSSVQGELGLNGLSFEGAELPEVARSGRKEGCYTFLLVGRDTSSGLTDTMMLITYSTKNQTIDAISLMRDTMVNTSGKSGGQKRLNAVFNMNQGDRNLPEEKRTANGISALRTEVSRLTGIYPDFYVIVEWEAIGRLVDAVGGVEFEVPLDMDYDDPYQDLHIHQKAGLRVLSGQDAMEVIRFRKNNDETVVLYDAGRTQIQRDFLTAVLKKCLTPEILLKLPSLVQIFTENVETDLSVGNILAFAQLAVGMDAENGVKFVSMPFYLVSYQGASLVCAQEKELLKLLNDGINPYLDEVKSSDLQLMYQKSNGAFGVTNASLADPAVAAAPARPQEPDKSDADGDPDYDPDVSTKPEDKPEKPGEEKPDNPGDDEPDENPDKSGTPADPAEIGTIDPSDIFPDTGKEDHQDAA